MTTLDQDPGDLASSLLVWHVNGVHGGMSRLVAHQVLHDQEDWFRRTIWDPARTAASLGFMPRIHDLHHLHHAHASWLLAGGADLQVVRNVSATAPSPPLRSTSTPSPTPTKQPSKPSPRSAEDDTAAGGLTEVNTSAHADERMFPEDPSARLAKARIAGLAEHWWSGFQSSVACQMLVDRRSRGSSIQ
ncbi:hypothetical protein ACRYCC_41135 [Actinomadura scrupuli]|uniref:hypothetical protein n=1 Tax=Actinomadura scrupuli TaxID=559629 RepID=UPI003D9724EC